MARAGDDVECGLRNRLLQSPRDPDGNHAIALPPDDRRRCCDAREALTELTRFVGGERADMSDERVASVIVGERSQIQVHRMDGAFGVAKAPREIAAQDGEQQARWQEAGERKRGPREASFDRRPTVERHAVDETQA